MSRQQVIPLLSGQAATLEDFAGVENGELLNELHRLVRGQRDRRILYLWGEPGSGKTHLLTACCEAFAADSGTARYVPASGGDFPDPSLLDSRDLVCIDDIDLVADHAEALASVMAIHERLLPSGGAMVVSGSRSPPNLGLALGDLASRLAAGGAYQLHEPGDGEKEAALVVRAHRLGLRMDHAVPRYMMLHHSRDMASLVGLLERLDSASLAAQRRITVPFLKSVLAGDPESS